MWCTSQGHHLPEAHGAAVRMPHDLPVPPRAVRELFDLTEGGTEAEPWTEQGRTLPTT